MKLRKGEMLSAVIIAAMFTFSVFLIPRMPSVMPVHWGFTGRADGYMQKIPAMLIMPFIAVLYFFVFVVITRIDPKKRMEEFAGDVDIFNNTALVLMIYMYLIMILSASGFNINMNVAMAPLFAVLFFALGGLMEKSKQNYFIGIRTPWTLENGEVWDKTHERAGTVMRLCAVASIGGLFLPNLLILFVLVPGAIGVIYLTRYSRDLFKSIQKR
jgi:uncharacterized membrane protein